MQSFAQEPRGNRFDATPARSKALDLDLQRRGGTRSEGPSPCLHHAFSRTSTFDPSPVRVQPKRTVSTPGDAHEREADRVAEEVVGVAGPKAHAGCIGGTPCSAYRNAQATPRNGASGRLQAQSVAPTGPRPATASPLVDQALSSSGHPLEPETRAFFEPRLGHDFSRVRIHADGVAGRSAHDLGARAYTVGHHIVFGAGQYAPGTHHGQRLIAHELTHVLQQRTGMHQVQRQESDGATPPVRSVVLRTPPAFKQESLTCWAAAMASWLLVKGIVKRGFSPRFLVDYYHGTSCVDDDDALVGEDAIEGVYAEWRLAIDMGSNVTESQFDAALVERTLQRHGHFILDEGSSTMRHALVVYGVEIRSATDATDFSLLVMDPLQGTVEKKHRMFIQFPVRFAVGLPSSGGPAPCRRE